jgi:hypothetical protein
MERFVDENSIHITQIMVKKKKKRNMADHCISLFNFLIINKENQSSELAVYNL